MPTRTQACATVACPEVVPRGRCTGCERAAEQRRGDARQRGYDETWKRRRAAYLSHNPICVLCGGVANVADHHPVSRRDLVRQGVTDPDADHRLRPLCETDHNRETAVNQPGGWNAR